MRKAEISRKTNETDITLSLCVDGAGKSKINTGCGFLDHMLTLFSAHGRFDLDIECKGDTNVDYHHTVEDCGICLGRAFSSALGDKAGICRFGQAFVPMDEALVLAAVDLSGRAALGYSLEIPTEKVGDFDCELTREFFAAFVRECGCALHLKSFSGENSHHVIEAAFKAAARAMRFAVSADDSLSGAVLSTKGEL